MAQKPATDTVAKTAAPDKAKEKAKEGVRRGDRQTRYLAQSVILEEAGSSGLVRTAIITVCIIIVAFVIWAHLTSVDEIAVTSGEVVPTGQVQVVQHLEGGIISAIMVREGDIVSAGDILIQLDRTMAQGELLQQQARLMSLDIQTERLRAVGEGNFPDFSFAGVAYRDMVEDQLKIYSSALEAADNRRNVLIDQNRQREAELSAFREEEETLLRNLQILEEEFVMRETLYNQGLATKGDYLDVQRQLNDAIGDLAKLTSERKKVAEALEESRSRLIEQRSDQREIALAEMGDLMAEVAALRESLARSSDRVHRLDVRAPVRGIIKGLQANTIGGVLPPGGQLLEIVPLDKELLIETRITTRDVGHVKVGQPVSVKVTTFDFARYGGITGSLKDISAATFVDEEGNPYYKGMITLNQSYVGGDPEQNKVLPGMTVQADINIGRKTLLEYLLKPIVSSVNESFRER